MHIDYIADRYKVHVYLLIIVDIQLYMRYIYIDCICDIYEIYATFIDYRADRHVLHLEEEYP